MFSKNYLYKYFIFNVTVYLILKLFIFKREFKTHKYVVQKFGLFCLFLPGLWHWNNLLKQIDFADMPNGSRLHIHDLRHIYAQSLLNHGIQLEDIQFLLGHQDISTTQRRYAMFARTDLHEKVKIMDNVIPFKKIV